MVPSPFWTPETFLGAIGTGVAVTWVELSDSITGLSDGPETTERTV